jgi:hypothetical protein
VGFLFWGLDQPGMKPVQETGREEMAAPPANCKPRPK